MSAEQLLPDFKAVTPCPDWCDEDIPCHISKDQVVVAEVGPERTEMFLSLEQEDVAGAKPSLRLCFSGDSVMTPATALELAAQLSNLAYRAMFR